MKAQELRVGNYFYNSHNEVCAVTTISKWYREFGVNIELINPIPLTEEWLEKFGFENVIFDATEEYPFWKKNNFKVYKHSKHHYIRPDYDGFVYKIPLKHIPIFLEGVHKLQNLYYALTNEELIINNKNNEQSNI